MDTYIEKLRQIADSYKNLSAKIKLYNLLNIAKEEYEKYDYNSSRNTLLQALCLSHESPEVYRGLGCVEQFDNNYDKALEYFFKALKYSNKKEVEYTLLGMVYYIKNSYDEAVKYFNLAIDENDNYENAYEGRNQAMLESHLKIVEMQEILEKYFK